MLEALDLMTRSFVKTLASILVWYSVAIVYFVLVLEVPDFKTLSVFFGIICTACVAACLADILVYVYGISYTSPDGTGAPPSKFTLGVVQYSSYLSVYIICSYLYMHLLVDIGAKIFQKLFS